MSKIKYTVDIDVTICEELESMRNMLKTHDFSGMAATIERIQHHANSMESGLWRNADAKAFIKYHADDKTMSNDDFRSKAKEVIEK